MDKDWQDKTWEKYKREEYTRQGRIKLLQGWVYNAFVGTHILAWRFVAKFRWWQAIASGLGSSLIMSLEIMKAKANPNYYEYYT